LEGDGSIDLLSGGVNGVQVLQFRTDGGNVVLPLTQPLTVDVIRLTCSATQQCGAEVNVVGQ